MPKIFGTGFHEIDLDRSVLRLRLDDMPQGDWIEFGFIPWPKSYRPGKSEVTITSVHINFIGSRARAGFRFKVPHRQSRFACSQDEIDELRSRQFPRKAQDQQFLEAARKHLLESFLGDAQHDLRILAVDLGETGAGAAVDQGAFISMTYRCLSSRSISATPEYLMSSRKMKDGIRHRSLKKGIGAVSERSMSGIISNN